MLSTLDAATITVTRAQRVAAGVDEVVVTGVRWIELADYETARVRTGHVAGTAAGAGRAARSWRQARSPATHNARKST
ncbi:hypothetical protein Acor_15280 [Acrocarpospora corrugata]|uniref:Uncharacterized protein n=1 Tax=Acrocarpospora corrugata TaxID=35763 RepID=A0A5M3VRR5_9ACTN|nr:hypothetical protein [Acrocarpospora corrugata]GER99464.1 hypothetical protein Acor_15280 [Acrocarpospora corrugata]